MLKAFGYGGAGCPLRGYAKYVLGYSEPKGAGAEYGSARHEECEARLLHGVQPTNRHSLAALQYAPKPLTCLPESKIRWVARNGVHHMGIIDFMGRLLSLALTQTSPHFAPGDPILFGDFKFVSNFNHALEAYNGQLVHRDTLAPDIQSTMYASYWFLKGYDEVWGRWIYVPTKNKGCKPRIAQVRFDRDRTLEEAEKISAYAAQVNRLIQIRPKLADIPRHEGHCRAYGVACPFEAECPKSSGMFDAGFVASDESEVQEMEDMAPKDFKAALDDILGPQDDDLPPPPMDDDDLPPPPPDEEDAPDEAETRALVEAELAARRAEEGKVGGIGIINPPEAPETAPATPEEAFERFGEKPKAAFVFLKEHRPALLEKAIELGLVEVKSRVTAPGLAKMLRAKGVDPEALVADLDPDGLPKDSLASQANAEQASHYEEMSKTANDALEAEEPAPATQPPVYTYDAQEVSYQNELKQALDAQVRADLDACKRLARALGCSVTLTFSPDAA